MPRPTGWSVLAEKALELSALALAVRFMDSRHPEVSKDREASSGFPVSFHSPSIPQGPSIPQDDITETSQPARVPEPLRFLRESADPQTEFFRASDDQVELLVAFFSDGRIRAADAGELRFAGMLTKEKGDLLEIGSNEWSRVFVRATPEGKRQIELQGGPYDMHVLTCEPMER